MLKKIKLLGYFFRLTCATLKKLFRDPWIWVIFVEPVSSILKRQLQKLLTLVKSSFLCSHEVPLKMVQIS